MLAGGNALAQLITIAASPVLTRLYTPEEFGLLAVYMALTTILGVIVSGRYQMAIALPESEREALEVTRLSLAIVLLFVLLTGVFVLFGREWLAAALNVPALGDYLLLLPVSVFLIGSFTVFRLWSVRDRQFARVGKARIRQVLASVTVQIVCAPLGALGLLLGQLANQGMGVRSLGRDAVARTEFREAGWSRLRAALVRYRRFPLLTIWAALMNRTSLLLPTLFFTVLFGPAAAGFYALASRILKTPSDVFVGAIISVFHTTAPAALREGWLRGLILATHERVSALALPPLAFAAIIAPPLFAVVFGAEWTVAGEYGRWIIVLVYFSLVASPLTGVFSALEKQGHELFFQGLMFVSRAAALWFGGRLGDPVLAVALFSVASAFSYLCIIVWVALQVDGALGPMARQFALAATAALLVCAPALLGHASEALSLRLGGTVVGGLACAAYLLVVLRRPFDPYGGAPRA